MIPCVLQSWDSFQEFIWQEIFELALLLQYCLLLLLPWLILPLAHSLQQALLTHKDIFSAVFALRDALRDVSALKEKDTHGFYGLFLIQFTAWPQLQGGAMGNVGMCAGSNWHHHCERLWLIKSSLLSTAFVIITKMWLSATALKGKY